MIQITQEELWAFNILNNQVKNVQSELQKDIAARDSYIKLLEKKYKAIFNPQTGQLEPKPKTEKTKKR